MHAGFVSLIPKWRHSLCKQTHFNSLFCLTSFFFRKINCFLFLLGKTLVSVTNAYIDDCFKSISKTFKASHCGPKSKSFYLSIYISLSHYLYMYVSGLLRSWPLVRVAGPWQNSSKLLVSSTMSLTAVQISTEQCRVVQSRTEHTEQHRFVLGSTEEYRAVQSSTTQCRAV